MLPDDFEMPPGGLNIRWPDQPLDQEFRLHRYKLYAALAFARANRLDRIVIDSPEPRFGIVTTGKSYLDVRQALDDLGIDDAHAAAIGLRALQGGDALAARTARASAHFAEGLEEILVVEEKRAVIENQLKEQLYNWPADVRPRDRRQVRREPATWILPSNGELTRRRSPGSSPSASPASTLRRGSPSGSPSSRRSERQLGGNVVPFARTPVFLLGLPAQHLDQGARRAAARWPASAAITCRNSWTGRPRPSPRWAARARRGSARRRSPRPPHVFANIGDGTYTHSGILAIRAAVAAKVNITYKVLFNDAVAMTGGQPLDGGLTVPLVAAPACRRGRRAGSSSSPTSPRNIRPAPTSRRTRRCATATSSTRCSASCAN